MGEVNDTHLRQVTLTAAYEFDRHRTGEAHQAEENHELSPDVHVSVSLSEPGKKRKIQSELPWGVRAKCSIMWPLVCFPWMSQSAAFKKTRNPHSGSVIKQHRAQTGKMNRSRNKELWVSSCTFGALQSPSWQEMLPSVFRCITRLWGTPIYKKAVFNLPEMWSVRHEATVAGTARRKLCCDTVWR